MTKITEEQKAKILTDSVLKKVIEKSTEKFVD